MGRVVEVSSIFSIYIRSEALSWDAYQRCDQNPFVFFVQIFGPESSGKTTLALHAIAEAQKAGKSTVFIDAEHALDKQYAQVQASLRPSWGCLIALLTLTCSDLLNRQALGVDTAKLMLVQPDCGEMALEVADQLARSGEIGMIVIDSVSALVPRYACLMMVNGVDHLRPSVDYLKVWMDLSSKCEKSTLCPQGRARGRDRDNHSWLTGSYDEQRAQKALRELEQREHDDDLPKPDPHEGGGERKFEGRRLTSRGPQ